MEDIKKALTLQECNLILENCLQNGNVNLISHTIKKFSENVEGFLGEHFLIEIQYEDLKGKKIQRCFMKVLNGSFDTIFRISQSLNAYTKEEFFYNTLLSEFKKYDISVSFAPECYFCRPYLIVLEDLSLKNYVGTPKNTFFDLNHCKTALDTLAKFHSSSVLYEAHKSEELKSTYSLRETYPQMFQEMIFSKETNLAKTWFNCSMKGILQLTQLIPENHISKKQFEESLIEFVEGIDNIVDTLTQYKSTILHGDVWINNFLFKYENEVPIQAILLDYQLLKCGPPSLDVIHMLLCNTRKQFRDIHFSELIEFYYTSLSNHLSKLQLGNFVPKSEYLTLCEDLQVLVKLQCICDRSVTYMSDDVVGEIFVNDESLQKSLFEDRGDAIITCYNNGGLFKEILEEDMLELRDMLFKK